MTKTALASDRNKMVSRLRRIYVFSKDAVELAQMCALGAAELQERTESNDESRPKEE